MNVDNSGSQSFSGQQWQCQLMKNRVRE